MADVVGQGGAVLCVGGENEVQKVAGMRRGLAVGQGPPEELGDCLLGVDDVVEEKAMLICPGVKGGKTSVEQFPFCCDQKEQDTDDNSIERVVLQQKLCLLCAALGNGEPNISCGGSRDEEDNEVEKDGVVDDIPRMEWVEETVFLGSSDCAVSQMSQFFSDVDQELSSLACRLLPHLTNSSSVCFLSVGKLGRCASSKQRLPVSSSFDRAILLLPGSFFTHLHQDSRDKGDEGRRMKSTSKAIEDMEEEEGEEEEGEEEELARRLDEEHYNVFKRLRGCIAAACTLSHRACQVLWGPVGSGKSRLLRAVAADARQRDHTLVFYLDGASFRTEMAAVRVIADQLLQFLLSPTSAAVRAADWSIRTGMFEFGKLFHFPQRLKAARRKRSSFCTRFDQGKYVEQNWPDNLKGIQSSYDVDGRKRGRVDILEEDEETDEENSSSNGEVVEEEEEEEEISSVFDSHTGPGSTAVNALACLDAALHQLREYHVNILICIRQAEQFCVWCDHLLYVLAGLLHDAGEHTVHTTTTTTSSSSSTLLNRMNNLSGCSTSSFRISTGSASPSSSVPPACSYSRGGGGLVFLFTSNGPDLKHLEKRLSSRLTPEARHVPLLPWTPRCLLRAVLRLVKELHACRALLGKTLVSNVAAGARYLARNASKRECQDGIPSDMVEDSIHETTKGVQMRCTEKVRDKVVKDDDWPSILEDVRCRLQNLQPFFPSYVLNSRAKTRVPRSYPVTPLYSSTSRAGALPPGSCHCCHGSLPLSFSPVSSLSFPQGVKDYGSFSRLQSQSYSPLPMDSTCRSNRSPQNCATSPSDTAGANTKSSAKGKRNRYSFDRLYAHSTLVSEFIVKICEIALQELEDGEWVNAQEAEGCVEGGVGGKRIREEEETNREDRNCPPFRAGLSHSHSTSASRGASSSSLCYSPPTVAQRMFRHAAAGRHNTRTISRKTGKNEDCDNDADRNAALEDSNRILIEDAFENDTSPDIAITITSSLLRQVHTGALTWIRASSREKLIRSFLSTCSFSFSICPSFSVVPCPSHCSTAAKVLSPLPFPVSSFSSPLGCNEKERACRNEASNVHDNDVPPFSLFSPSRKDHSLCHGCGREPYSNAKEGHSANDAGNALQTLEKIWELTLPAPPPAFLVLYLLEDEKVMSSGGGLLEERITTNTSKNASKGEGKKASDKQINVELERLKEGRMNESGIVYSDKKAHDLFDFLGLCTSTTTTTANITNTRTDRKGNPGSMRSIIPSLRSSLLKSAVHGLNYFMAGIPPFFSLPHPSWLWKGNNHSSRFCPLVLCSGVECSAATAARFAQWCSVMECTLLPHLISFASSLSTINTEGAGDDGGLMQEKEHTTTLPAPPSSFVSSPFEELDDQSSLLGAYDLVLQGGGGMSWITCGFASRETFLILCTLTLFDRTVKSNLSTATSSRPPSTGAHPSNMKGPPHRTHSTSTDWKTLEDILHDVDRLSSLTRHGMMPISNSARCNAFQPTSSTGMPSFHSKPNNYHTSVYRIALEQLHRWGILAMSASGEQVRLTGDPSRWKDMVGFVLTQNTNWCEQILGLDSQEILRFRNLLDH